MRGLKRPRQAGWLAAVGLLALLGAGSAAGGDRVRVELLAEVVVEPGSVGSRQRVLSQGIREAVIEVALREAGREPEADSDDLGAALGRDPLVYTERFRVVEDHGEGPGLDPQGEATGETLYRALVEVYVASDRVRRRLLEAGLVIEAEEAPLSDHRVVLEGVVSPAQIVIVKEQLLARRSVENVEVRGYERGRVRLRVASRQSPEALAVELSGMEPSVEGVWHVERVAGGLRIVLR